MNNECTLDGWNEESSGSWYLATLDLCYGLEGALVGSYLKLVARF